MPEVSGGGPAVLGAETKDAGDEGSEMEEEEVMMEGSSSGMDVDIQGGGGSSSSVGGSSTSAFASTETSSSDNLASDGLAGINELFSVEMMTTAVGAAGAALGPPLIRADPVSMNEQAPAAPAGAAAVPATLHTAQPSPHAAAPAPAPAAPAAPDVPAAAAVTAAATETTPAFVEKDIYYTPGDRAPKAKKTYMASLGMAEIEAAREMRAVRHEESVRMAAVPLGGRRGRPKGSRTGGRGRGRTGSGGYGEGGRRGANIVIGNDDDHDDQCHVCATPGELLMCDTCTRSVRPRSDPNCCTCVWACVGSCGTARMCRGREVG